MPAYGWMLDPKRCIECRACEAACKQWNGVETSQSVRYRRVTVRESGVFPTLSTQALSMACNHCENALCMKACPVKAIWRRDEDGAVLVDRERCVGCRQCEKFCPYHAPQFNVRTRKMERCTMCFDRVEVGLQPACVTLCPTGALQFGKWEEIEGKGSPTFEGFSTPTLTRPRVRFAAPVWPGR